MLKRTSTFAAVLLLLTLATMAGAQQYLDTFTGTSAANIAGTTLSGGTYTWANTQPGHGTETIVFDATPGAVLSPAGAGLWDVYEPSGTPATQTYYTQVDLECKTVPTGNGTDHYGVVAEASGTTPITSNTCYLGQYILSTNKFTISKTYNTAAAATTGTTILQTGHTYRLKFDTVLTGGSNSTEKLWVYDVTAGLWLDTAGGWTGNPWTPAVTYNDVAAYTTGQPGLFEYWNTGTNGGAGGATTGIHFHNFNSGQFETLTGTISTNANTTTSITPQVVTPGGGTGNYTATFFYGGSTTFTANTSNGSTAIGATSLVLTSAAGFPASGTVWVPSQAGFITYTSIAGNTLNGIPGSSTGSVTATIPTGSTVATYTQLGTPVTGAGPLVASTAATGLTINTTYQFRAQLTDAQGALVDATLPSAATSTGLSTSSGVSITTATPGAINVSATHVITFTGSGTHWTTTAPTIGLANTGGTYTAGAVTVDSATQCHVSITANAVTGSFIATLTNVTDGALAAPSVTVGTPSISTVSPTSITTSTTGTVVTFTGQNTVFTQDTPTITINNTTTTATLNATPAYTYTDDTHFTVKIDTNGVAGSFTATLNTPAITSPAITVSAGPLVILPNSAAIHYSPGNWTGNLVRGPSATQAICWADGAYFTVYWSTTSGAPTCTLQLTNATAGSKIGYAIDGVFTDNVTVASSGSITVTVVGSGAHVLTVYTRQTTHDVHWTLANAYSLASVTLDSSSTAGTAPALNPWILEIGDSITDGVDANGAGLDDIFNGYAWLTGQAMVQRGYDYCVSAVGFSGWVQAGDSSGDVPPYYSVTGATLGVYTSGALSSPHRWDNIDTHNSFLRSGLISAYGTNITNDQPAVITLNYGTNEVLNAASIANMQASIYQCLIALRAAAPNAYIIVYVPFNLYTTTTLGSGPAYATAIKAAVNAYLAAHLTDTKTSLADFGIPLSSYISTANGSVTHPNQAGHAYATNYAVPYILNKLAATVAGTKRKVQ